MGLTPLDGLMMGTRSGSIDPSIIKYMIDEAGMTYDAVTVSLEDAISELLEKNHLLGISFWPKKGIKGSDGNRLE